MEINYKELDNVITNLEDNNLVKINNKLEITKRQLNILDKYGIKYNAQTDLNNIIFLIGEILNTTEDITDEEYDELDKVSEELSERYYYNNTNK